MAQRGITEDEVRKAFAVPDEMTPSFGSRLVARKQLGQRDLEVVYIGGKARITVITAYWLERRLMKISYDPEADALYIQFQEGSAGKTKKVEEGILIDLDEQGRLLGIEILGVSEWMPLSKLGEIELNLPIATAG